MGTQVEMKKTGKVVAKRTNGEVQIFVSEETFEALASYKAVAEDGTKGPLEHVISELCEDFKYDVVYVR